MNGYASRAHRRDSHVTPWPPSRPRGAAGGEQRPGAVDREMIADLIRAIDTVAARCDVIADRLDHQNIVVNDAVTIFGEELTRLRAESAPVLGDAERPSPPPLGHSMSEPGTDGRRLFLSRSLEAVRIRAFVRHPRPGGRGVTDQPGHGPGSLCGRSHRARRCLRSDRRRGGA